MTPDLVQHILINYLEKMMKMFIFWWTKL